jgi:hypothetical protein
MIGSNLLLMGFLTEGGNCVAVRSRVLSVGSNVMVVSPVYVSDYYC